MESSDLFIEGEWAGTIFAPWAKLVLGQTEKLLFGRFVGGSLTIHQNAEVHRIDFAPVDASVELVLR